MIAITSCNQSNSKDLELLSKAERLVDEQPDSTLLILETIHLPELLPAADYARYCLLITQSKDRRYISIASDSLIYIAFDYYNKSNDTKNKSLSLYYLGRRSEENNQQEKALIYYLEALKYAHTINDRKLLGRITSRMGNLYLNQMLYDKASEMFYNSLQYLQSENDIRGEVFTLRDLGCTHFLNGNARIFTSLGDIYISENKLDSAILYLRKSIDLATENQILMLAYGKLSEIARQKEDWNSACEYLNKFVIYNDSNISRVIDENILKAEKEYHLQLVKNLYLTNEVKHKKIEVISSILLSILLILITLILLWSFFRERKRKIQIDLQHQLFLKKNEEEKRLRKLIFLKTDSFILLNSRKKDPTVKFPENFWAKILSEFDTIYNNITLRLRKRAPELSEQQIVMACLIKIDFDSIEIARCMGLTKTNARSVKFRLKTLLKIPENVKNLEEFLHHF